MSDVVRTCQSVGRAVVSVRDAFGPRCGLPAVYRNSLGSLVCEACGLRQKRVHESGETLFSILRPGVVFTLDPLEPLQ